MALEAAGLNGKVHVVAEGGSVIVYVDRTHASEIVSQAVKALEGVEGTARIIGETGTQPLVFRCRSGTHKWANSF